MLGIFLGCVGGLLCLVLMVALVVVICYRSRRQREAADSRPMVNEDKRHVDQRLSQWKTENKRSVRTNGVVPKAKTQHIMEMLDASALAIKQDKQYLKTKVPTGSTQRNGKIPNRTHTFIGTTDTKCVQDKRYVSNISRNTFPQRNGYIPNGNGTVKTELAQNGLGRNGTLQNGSVRAGMTPNGSVRAEMIQNGSVPNGNVQSGIVQNGSVPNGIVKYGLLQNGSINNGSVHNGYVQHGSIQPNTVALRVLDETDNKAKGQKKSKCTSLVHTSTRAVHSDINEAHTYRKLITHKQGNRDETPKHKLRSAHIDYQQSVVTIPVNMTAEDEHQRLLQKQNEAIEQLDEALNEFHNDVFEDETTIVTDILPYEVNELDKPALLTNRSSADVESKDGGRGIIAKRSSADSAKKRNRNASSVSFVLPEDHMDKPYSPLESSRHKSRNQTPEVYVSDNTCRVRDEENNAPANAGELQTQNTDRGIGIFNSSFKRLLNGKHKPSSVKDITNGEVTDIVSGHAILHSTFVHVGSL